MMIRMMITMMGTQASDHLAVLAEEVRLAGHEAVDLADAAPRLRQVDELLLGRLRSAVLDQSCSRSELHQWSLRMAGFRVCITIGAEVRLCELLTLLLEDNYL